MKRKLLFAGVFLVVLLWLASDYNPAQLFISFVAAGSLPGVDFSLHPYTMMSLALGVGVLFLLKLSPLELRIAFEEAAPVPKKKRAKTKARNSRTRRVPSAKAEVVTQ